MDEEKVGYESMGSVRSRRRRGQENRHTVALPASSFLVLGLPARDVFELDELVLVGLEDARRLRGVDLDYTSVCFHDTSPVSEHGVLAAEDLKAAAGPQAALELVQLVVGGAMAKPGELANGDTAAHVNSAPSVVGMGVHVAFHILGTRECARTPPTISTDGAG